MARSRTLGDMRNDVRLRADLPANNFVTDSEIIEYLNQGIAELWDLIVAARGQEYYVKRYNFTTTAATELYAVPDDHFETLYLECFVNNQRIRMRPYSLHERAPILGVTQLPARPYAFRLQGPQISLLPIPDGPYPCTLFYAPAAARLAADVDTFDGIDGWEEYAIWRAVAYVQQKEQLDFAFAMGLLANMKERISRLAPFRAANNAERVTDAYRRLRYDLDPGLLLPRP